VNLQREHPISFKELLEYARRTQPLYGTPKDSPPQQLELGSRKSRDTRLGVLFEHIATYPLEIQQLILSFVDPHQIACLLKAEQVAHRSLRVSNLREPRLLHKTPFNLLSGIHSNKLAAHTVQVLGQAYLQKLQVGRITPSDDQVVPTKESSVRGLKFVLGLYGVRAIRIVYCDGSTSPWLGDPSRGFYGTIYGSDLGNLRTLDDVSSIVTKF